ncbi:MAG: cation-translocating P-type ATPase [Desulfobacterales bacterium]|nr:cation-translocating P-type ATPase [Desulfobacterales bacterium]
MKSLPGACDLCGLSLQYGSYPLSTPEGDRRFCCLGCRQVFVMLMEASGASDPAQFRRTEIYRRCVDAGIIPKDENDLAARSRGWAAPAEERRTEEGAASGLSLHLEIEGMWCPACAWVIEEMLHRKDGVFKAACHFSTDRLRAVYDPVRTSPERIRQVVHRLGYRTALPEESPARRRGRAEFVRFAVSAFLAMNVMMLSFALYSGFFTELPEESVRYLSWPIFLMSTAVMAYGGLPIFSRAVLSIPTGAFGMETLVGAGAASAYLYSVFNFASGSLHLYFDTASMLITLVLLGKLMERRAKDRVQEDLTAVFTLRPAKVRICTENDPNGRYLPAELLAAGDRFRVEAGEVAAADGLVLEGAGIVDESSLTGEAAGLRKRAGDRIVSGSRIHEGSLLIRAEAAGADSVLGQMIQIMETALEEKTPLETRTDRALRFLVPLVLFLAAVTAVFCLLRGAAVETAVIRAVTVMVISCPCALGIAIPLARVAGISMAGRRGILVPGFSAFEEAEAVDAVVFDKTGTLTTGRWELREILPLAGWTETELLALAAGLEAGSDHAVGREILRQAQKRGIAPAPVAPRRQDAQGICGSWNQEPVRIGSRGFADPGGRFSVPDEKSASAVDSLRSMVYMTVGGRSAGVLVFGDTIREGSAAAIRQLAADGYRLSVVSGDGTGATAAIAGQLGVADASGDMTPEGKAGHVQELRRSGYRVAMIGDGVNDAPALASADLGLAVHGGGAVGAEAAQVTLMKRDLRQLVDFFALAGQVNRKIHQNLAFSFLYNAIAIPVAMAGLLSPLVAVTAMLCSSLSVIGNTLWLIKSQPA